MNQKGFAAILMTSVVLIMVLTFMGSAAVYFGDLYKEIARQQRVLAAHAVTEDFAKMIQKARENWSSSAPNCPAATTIADAANQLCWPRPTGSSPTAHCVPHPFANTNANNASGSSTPILICISGPGFSSPSQKGGSMEVVLEMHELPDPDFPHYLKRQFYVWKKNLQMGVDILASRLQNWAEAQTSNFAYLPSLSGAPSSRFSTALNCAPAAASATYCKKCPGLAGANLDRCIGIRVCLKPGGNCNAANNNDWVLRTVGLLGRD